MSNNPTPKEESKAKNSTESPEHPKENGKKDVSKDSTPKIESKPNGTKVEKVPEKPKSELELLKDEVKKLQTDLKDMTDKFYYSQAELWNDFRCGLGAG